MSAFRRTAVSRTIALIAVLGATALATAQQPRDAVNTAAAVGTGRIVGIVTTDDNPPKPLRRARVMINSTSLPVGRTVIAQEDGSFAFDRLPAGNYTMEAAKDPFVPMYYGARRPGRPGARIAVRDGQTRRLTIPLPRGSVLSGQVTDLRGDPVPGIRVEAMQYRFFAPTASQRLQRSRSALTDDLGVYRIYGLAPGEYVVAAQVGRNIASYVSTAELQPPSAADMRLALAELDAAPGAVYARPGLPPDPPPLQPPPATPERYVSPAPVFFPGTTLTAQARTITLGRGEEREGLDFTLDLVPTATVSGFVAPSSSGARTRSVTIVRAADVGSDFLRGATVGQDGAFTFAGIPPGRYVITARASAPRSAERPAAGVLEWGSAEIAVDGEDIDGVAIGLQPGLTIAGRVVFHGGRPPIDLAGFEAALPAARMAIGMIVQLPSVAFEDGGRFRISGLIPGRFALATEMRGVRAPIGSWWLKSMVVDGREILDEPLEFRRSSDDAVVTFSDRASELSGHVTDAQRASAGDVHVIVFSVTRSTWFPGSRRIAAVRTSDQGRYSIRNLPEGEYHVAATDDVAHGEWFDPAFLAQIAGSAVRVSIRGDHSREQHVRLAGRQVQ